MRIVFMGTPAFAVPALEQLLQHNYEVVAVVTQPDRPQGRKRVLTPPPVKVAAMAAGLPVLQPEKMRSPEAIAQVAAYQPDLIVTAAYGQILPKAVLDLPKYGCINVHGSLLPQYRGGAPIQRSIINGESETGITIMYMAEGLDTGDMISSVVVPITESDTSGTLFETLSEKGAALLIETLPRLLAGEIVAQVQNEAEATYAPNLTREDERLDWNKSATALFNQIRGLSPMAGGYTIWQDQPFKVWASLPNQAEATAHPAGTIVTVDDDGVYVQTGDGVLLLQEVQPAGKKKMSANEWATGARINSGQDRFTSGDSL
ncbi:methionyl-tRNA formyltransferase [Paenibacillus yanchengensis]|uniref:Methionyl-tRNA formyltransferase n=1 Tax=Paenibacillus yanchengensis TaxID=2035833 RepID=A0ABW4YN69_9BACL